MFEKLERRGEIDPDENVFDEYIWRWHNDAVTAG